MLSKRWLIAAWVLVAALGLAACGSPDTDTPEGLVEEFFNRLNDEDQADVRALMCPDFRQNVNLELDEDRDVDYDFDLRYEAKDEGEEGDTIEVVVFGRMEMHLSSENVRYEVRERRTVDSPWTVRLARLSGEWQVCGADPQILTLLDARTATDALE